MFSSCPSARAYVLASLRAGDSILRPVCRRLLRIAKARTFVANQVLYSFVRVYSSAKSNMLRRQNVYKTGTKQDAQLSHRKRIVILCSRATL